MPLAGTGPFRIASITPQATVLERFPEHWRRAPANLDAIEFRAVPTAAMGAGLRSGELDLIRVVAPNELEDSVEGFGLSGARVEAPMKTSFFALFNTRGGPNARDMDLRLALAQSVPVQELPVDALDAAGVALGQVRRVAAVQAAPATARDLGVQHLAHDAADEGQAIAARRSLLLQQALLDHAVDRRVQVVCLFGQVLELAGVEALAEHRGAREHLAQRVGQAADAAIDRLLHGLRERAGEMRRAQQRPRVRGLRGRLAAAEQRAHDLTGEEGIALGGAVEVFDHEVGHRQVAQQPGQQLAVLGPTERPEVDQHKAARSAQLLDQAVDRVVAVDLGAAIGRYDQGRRRGQAAHDVLQRLDRRVGRVQVLEEQHQRLA